MYTQKDDASLIKHSLTKPHTERRKMGRKWQLDPHSSSRVSIREQVCSAELKFLACVHFPSVPATHPLPWFLMSDATLNRKINYLNNLGPGPWLHFTTLLRESSSHFVIHPIAKINYNLDKLSRLPSVSILFWKGAIIG